MPGVVLLQFLIFQFALSDIPLVSSSYRLSSANYPPPKAPPKINK